MKQIQNENSILMGSQLINFRHDQDRYISRFTVINEVLVKHLPYANIAVTFPIFNMRILMLPFQLLFRDNKAFIFRLPKVKP